MNGGLNSNIMVSAGKKSRVFTIFMLSLVTERLSRVRINAGSDMLHYIYTSTEE